VRSVGGVRRRPCVGPRGGSCGWPTLCRHYEPHGATPPTRGHHGRRSPLDSRCSYIPATRMTGLSWCSHGMNGLAGDEPVLLYGRQ
jgi:hypothetical protein